MRLFSRVLRIEVPSRNRPSFCGKTCTLSFTPPFAQSNNLQPPTRTPNTDLLENDGHYAASPLHLLCVVFCHIELVGDTKCILRVAPRLTLCMQDNEWLHFPSDVPYRLCLVKGKVAAEQNQSRLPLFGVNGNFDTPQFIIVGSRSSVLALRSVGIGEFHPVSNRHPFAHGWVALAFSS